MRGGTCHPLPRGPTMPRRPPQPTAPPPIHPERWAAPWSGVQGAWGLGPGGVVVGLAWLWPAPPKKTGGSQKFRNRFAPNLGILPATPYVMIWRNTIDFCPVDFENGELSTALLCCCLWKRSEKELQIGGKSWWGHLYLGKVRVSNAAVPVQLRMTPAGAYALSTVATEHAALLQVSTSRRQSRPVAAERRKQLQVATATTSTEHLTPPPLAPECNLRLRISLTEGHRGGGGGVWFEEAGMTFRGVATPRNHGK